MTAQAEHVVQQPRLARRSLWQELPAHWLTSTVITILALGLFGLTVTLFLRAQDSAYSQISQLDKTVTGYQKQLTADNARIATLSGQVSALQARTAPLAADTTRCATGLSGPVGSAAYYFWCSPVQAPKRSGK